jgi:hypothetical protein
MDAFFLEINATAMRNRYLNVNNGYGNQRSAAIH